ncbi:ABC transporter ATP-binding protein [Nitratidesulfovibrio sp. HK-II]|uniref:ABC transporter ATP-binding protein n=1 Tax=Nitratidesulfovibrio sp. HK-II TaxID=2009266 RepID=UPI001E652B1B|nr:ABC transporter ATP-binding protein [Nitratidesulfovibrio sp. HK-II]
MTRVTYPIIVLSDIHLNLVGGSGQVNILRGVNLSVDAGETVAIVGPSGSGKTTTLMIMAGLERPTGGTVQVAGQNLNEMDEDALARFRRAHLGIVFQSFHLVPTMTALENAALPLEFSHARDARDRAMAALAAVGLEARALHYPAELSGGEQQRVALARAFASAPRVILADEPTGNLDTETGRRVIEHLFRLREEHATTLVLITHDRGLAAECGRQVRMEDGRLYGAAMPGAAVASGTPDTPAASVMPGTPGDSGRA